ncbi:MAG: protein phosphatase CheZ [Alphaproteobacteria bacterium]|nr:protein phosphatase CheZ [Alphaproteobacteria bacterium]
MSDTTPSTAASPDLAAMRSEILQLRALLDGLEFERKPETGPSVGREVRVEIARMVRQISRVKSEIASIKRTDDENDDMLSGANRQLETIISSTEEATNTIMSTTDEIEEIVKQVRMRSPENTQMNDVLEDISGRLIGIIEACSFQDLTGQRIVKVIQTLRFLEQRLASMIDIWGVEAFKDVPVIGDETAGGEEIDPGEILEGPAMEGEGLSQDDIDALFD